MNANSKPETANIISATEMSRYCGTIQAKWSSLGGLGACRTATSSLPKRSRTHNTYTPPMRTTPSPEPLTSPSALSTCHLNLHQFQSFLVVYEYLVRSIVVSLKVKENIVREPAHRRRLISPCKTKPVVVVVQIMIMMKWYTRLDTGRQRRCRHSVVIVTTALTTVLCLIRLTGITLQHPEGTYFLISSIIYSLQGQDRTHRVTKLFALKNYTTYDT